MRRRRQVNLSPGFRLMGQRRLMGYEGGNGALESPFSKLSTFLKSTKPLSRNRNPNVTQSGKVCANCCRPEVDCDVIVYRNVKTIEGYVVVNVEVASSNCFCDFPQKIIL